jgi:hypothetical protein
LTSSSQTESFTANGSIAALSGSGYGSDTTSYANGDTFTPLPGTSDTLNVRVVLPNSTVAGFGTTIVYVPTQGIVGVTLTSLTAMQSDYIFCSGTNAVTLGYMNGNNDFSGVSSTGLAYFAQSYSNQFVALSYALAYTDGFHNRQ